MKSVRLPRLLFGAVVVAFTVSCIRDAPTSPRPAGEPVLRLVSGADQTAAVGSALTAPVIVEVAEAQGRPLARREVDVFVLHGRGVLRDSTLLTDARGRAQIAWTLGERAGEVQAISIRLRGAPAANDSATLEIQARAVAGEPHLMAARSPSILVGPGGKPLSDPLAVLVTDRFGNPVPGAPVSWSVSDGGGTVSPAVSVADSQGIARTEWTPAGSEMDVATATANLAGVEPLAFQARLIASNEARVSIAAGDRQSGAGGAPLPDSLAVALGDPSGTPRAGVVVSWFADPGSGVASPVISTTDEHGIARTQWTLGEQPGEQRVRAVAAGEAAVLFVGWNGPAAREAAVSADPVGPPAAFRRISGDGQTASAGTALPDSLVMQVVDAAGQPVPGVEVTWQALRGGGTVSPARATTNAAGQVKTQWTVGTAAGSEQMARAVLTGVTPGAFRATVTAAPATRVVVAPDSVRLDQPGNTAVLTALLTDAYGNPASGTVAWTSLDPAVASVSGAGLVTAVASSGSARIEARLGSLVDTARVVVQAQPTSLAFVSNPDTLRSLGDTVTLRVEARDQSGNLVPAGLVVWSVLDVGVVGVDSLGRVSAVGPGSARVVARSGDLSDTALVVVRQRAATVGLSPDGDATLLAGDTMRLTAVPRDAGGTPLASPSVAWSSSDTTVVRVDAGGRVLARRSGATLVIARVDAVADTVVIQVVSGAPVAFQRVSSLRQTGVVGEVLPEALVVRVVDAAGSPVPSVSVTWQALRGGGSVGTPVAITDAAGLAQTTWRLGTGAGTEQMARAVAAGVTPAAFLATGSAAAPARVVASVDSVTFQTLTDSARLTALVQDQYSNPVTVAVAWQSLDPGTATVDATGRVSGVGSGVARVVATAGSAADTVRVVVRLAPVAFRVVSGRGQTAAAGARLGDSVVIQVMDAAGRGVPYTPVTWQVLRGGGSIPYTQATTDAQGITRNAWTVGTVAGSDQMVRVVYPGLTPAAFTAAVVAGPPAAIQTQPDSVVLRALGDSAQVTAVVRDTYGNAISGAVVSWASADSSVVRVPSPGLLVGSGAGRTQVLLSTGSLSVPLVARVDQLATRVQISDSAVVMTSLGDSAVLQAVALDARGQPLAPGSVAWRSLDAAVVGVPAPGVLVGLAPGTGRVEASSNGAADTVVVRVEQVPVSLALTAPTDSLKALSDTIQLSVYAQDARGNAFVPTGAVWTSLNPSVVQVNGTGRAVSVANGSTPVIVQVGAHADTVTLHVQQILATIALQAVRALAVGDSVRVAAQGLDARGNPLPGAQVSFSSLSPGVVSVESSGTARGISTGTGIVLATSGDVADTLLLPVVEVAQVFVGGVAQTATGSVPVDAPIVITNGHLRLRIRSILDSASHYIEYKNAAGEWVNANEAREGDWTYYGSSVLTRATSVEVISVKPGEVAVRWTYGNHVMPVIYDAPSYSYRFSKTVWLRAGESGYYAQIQSLDPTPAGVGEREHEIGWGGVWGDGTIRTRETTLVIDTTSSSVRLNTSWGTDAVELDRTGDPLIRVLVALPGGEYVVPVFPSLRGGTYLHLLGNSLTYGAYLYVAERADAMSARAVCRQAWTEAPFTLPAVTASQLDQCGPNP
jgi:hypothetical protein